MIRNKKKQNEIIELIPYGLKATCIALSILNRVIKNHNNRKYADEYSECGKLICDIDANNPTARECNIIDYFFRHEVLESAYKDIAEIFENF